MATTAIGKDALRMLPAIANPSTVESIGPLKTDCERWNFLSHRQVHAHHRRRINALSLAGFPWLSVA
jgi:hypothetical protein